MANKAHKFITVKAVMQASESHQTPFGEQTAPITTDAE